MFLRLVRRRALAVPRSLFVAFIAFVRAAPTAADGSLTGDAALTHTHTRIHSHKYLGENITVWTDSDIDHDMVPASEEFILIMLLE